MLKRIQFLRVIVIAALLTLLTACGGTDSSAGDATDSPSSTTTDSSSAHSEADVSFATKMIPHHAQAIKMAEMAIKQSQDPAVLKLAKDIKRAQSPEIKTMTGWLKSWGSPAPEPRMASMPGMSHNTPGMMSSQDLNRMMNATGAEFDRMWLEMMTEHHQGAIKMAQMEVRDGQSTSAKNLAQRIISAQRAEINTMQKMLHETMH